MFCITKLLCGLVSLLVAVRSTSRKKTRGLGDDGAATRRGTVLRMLSDCTQTPEITPTARQVSPLGDAHGPSPLHQAQGLAGWGRSRPGAAVSTPIGAAGVAPAAVRLAGDSGAAVGAAGLVWGAPWGSCGGGFRYSAVLFDR